jgi:NAD(P)-dependent dehydrogenase (short-subunit alcohol dehydrogenase family)
MKLENKVAIITGSSRGIGRAIALEFAREGANVVVTYLKERGKAEEVLNEINAVYKEIRNERKINLKATIVKMDVTKREEVRNTVKAVLENYSTIDILVNNAGINKPSDFLDIKEEDWDEIIKVNLKGAYICCQEVLPAMVKQNSGNIINISSVSGQYGGPRTAHYAVSKAGLIMLGYNLAINFAKHNIRVNNLSPGLIESEMAKAAAKLDIKIPMDRKGTPQEVAKAAVFLASGDSSYMTAHTLNLNGGLYF